MASPPRSDASEAAIPHPHPGGRAQHWDTVDGDLARAIDALNTSLATVLEPAGFVGSYLHGSLAMGSFYRPKSDIDLLVVVDDPLTTDQRRAAAMTLCDHADRLPTTGDLEVSVLRRVDAHSSEAPPRFEVHYSEQWKPALRAGTVDFGADRTDLDLVAHRAVTRARGVRLTGPPIAEVFGPVAIEAVRTALLDDLDWILADEHVLESPFYAVLNLCRVAALAQERGWTHVLSKDEGGEWALANLPSEHRAVVAQALACYRSPEPVSPAERRTDGHDWDEPALLAFRDFGRRQRTGW
jgi:predicted nucleotidyltransferase